METSRGENTALIMRFHYNHLFSIIQTKLIQAKNSKSKVCPKKFARCEVYNIYGHTLYGFMLWGVRSRLTP